MLWLQITRERNFRAGGEKLLLQPGTQVRPDHSRRRGRAARCEREMAYPLPAPGPLQLGLGWGSSAAGGDQASCCGHPPTGAAIPLAPISTQGHLARMTEGLCTLDVICSAWGREGRLGCIPRGGGSPGHKAFVSELLAECQPHAGPSRAPVAVAPLSGLAGSDGRGWGPFCLQGPRWELSLEADSVPEAPGVATGLRDGASVSSGRCGVPGCMASTDIVFHGWRSEVQDKGAGVLGCW